MPEEDQTPQATSASPAAVPGVAPPADPPVTPPVTPPVAAKVGDTTQINRMRKNLVTEIKELRKQVLLVQLQSMKVMQQSIHSVFKTQTNKTSEQIILQGTDLQKQLEEETEALQSVTTDNTNNTNENPGSEDGQIEVFNDIVLNALQAAQHSIDSAMESTQHIMTEARNLLKDL